MDGKLKDIEKKIEGQDPKKSDRVDFEKLKDSVKKKKDDIGQGISKEGF